MRWLVALLILLATLLPLSAEDWTTVDGTVYKNVTVLQVADDGLTITYDGGTAKIPYYNLPLDVQKQYGHDPDTLAAKQKEADDAEAAHKAAVLAAQEQVAAQQKQQADDAAQIKALDAAQAANHPHVAETPSDDSAPEVANRAGDRVSYPGAEYSYNKFQDISTLDSPVINVVPLPSPLATDPQGPHTSLVLRSESQGAQPQHADRIVATVLSVGTVWKLTDGHDILFLVDGASIPIADSQIRDTDFLVGLGQVVEFVSFYLTPQQAQTIIGGKSVNFSIGNNDYAVDTAGLATLRKYLAVLDPLPIPPSPLVRKYNDFVNKIPSIPTLISKTCEYVILGGFSIAILLGFLACCLGAARFMRW